MVPTRSRCSSDGRRCSRDDAGPGGRAGFSHQADHDRRSVRSRHDQRHHRPPACAGHDGHAGPERHRRESRRRHGQHRDRLRREVAARRLHAGDRLPEQHPQPGHRQRDCRPDQGLHAGRLQRRHALFDAGAQRASGEERGRAGRARPQAARQAQLGLCRRRPAVPGRDVQSRGQGQHRDGALQEHDRRPGRSDVQPHPDLVHPHRVGHSDPERQAGPHDRRHGRDPVAVLPDIPTFKEAGYPDLTVGVAYFLLAAKGTPQPVVDKPPAPSTRRCKSEAQGQPPRPGHRGKAGHSGRGEHLSRRRNPPLDRGRQALCAGDRRK